MRHATVASFVGLAAVGVLTGCPDRSISEVDPAQDRVEFKDIPVKINRDVDILFVIDNSPSMSDKQQNLADNFRKFIDVLDSIQGGRPNVHIAVVTSDMGSKGAGDSMLGPVIPGDVTGAGRCADVGDDGVMTLTGAPVRGPFISDILQTDGTRTQNYDGDSSALSTVFETMAKVGAKGCGFEQHLEAMKKALQPSTATNKGFLRESAYLAVVFIADEDDCSLEHSSLLTSDTSQLGPQQSFRCTRFGITCDDNGQTPTAMNVIGSKGKCHPNDASAYLTKVGDYVTFLKNLKPGDDGKVIVAGIMGPTEPFATELRPPDKNSGPIPALAHSCSYIGGDGKPEVADPPIRLKFFLDQFPNRSTFAPICQRDLSGGLQQIGDLLKAVIGDPCIEGKLADVDPTTDGAQYDCSVSSVNNVGKANQVEDIIPHCNPEDGSGTSDPCWHLVPNQTKCPNSDHLMLTIEHNDKLLLDTHVRANCVTQVTN